LIVIEKHTLATVMPDVLTLILPVWLPNDTSRGASTMKDAFTGFPDQTIHSIRFLTQNSSKLDFVPRSGAAVGRVEPGASPEALVAVLSCLPTAEARVPWAEAEVLGP
jgi:hypothetical protein